MPYRIEIGLKRGVPDARGRGVAGRAREFLRLPLRSCVTRDVYKVDVALNRREAGRMRAALADAVVARSAMGRLRPPRFDWLVEIGFKPGVTDNVGRTARVVAQDIAGRTLAEGEDVYTAVQYFLRGDGLKREDAEKLADQLLANRLIERVELFSPEDWANHPVDESVPAIREELETTVRTYNLSGSDEDLMRISREGILSLSLLEMHAIRDHYADPALRRERATRGLPPDPTDVELECLAQTWSEHCKHKIFAGRVHYVDEKGREEWIDSLFTSCIRAATEEIAARVDWLVSVFSDNAGIIRFNDRHYLSYKVETHNSPSALDPYGGAITGIVGVNRDPLGTGLGCELLYNVWGYCLGSPTYEGDLPQGLMHPRRIRDGVHQGVIDGGNQSGIPWARGFERFDDRYIGKPLVFCGTVGRLPHTVGERRSETKAVVAGDAVVMAGGRIGKDGIHGATFSSEELRQESPAQAVQIGDPITQRMLYEFLLEARDLGLYRNITDNGAGGLSSSVGEMCQLSGGAELDLARAPLKYQGLMPWEIFLSEAQERMTLAVPADRLAGFLELAARREVEATALGVFSDDGVLTLRHGERLVGRLELDFLHHGCPRMDLEARWTPPEIPAPKTPRAGSRNRALRSMLASLNLCSKEYKSRRYDAEVKGLSVLKPYVGRRCDVPGDATVMRVDYDSREGVVLAEGINPFYADLDTYHMMASVIDEAVRRIVSVGGRLDHIAGLDNFCWPDPVLSEKTPDGPYKMAQLVRANKAIYDMTIAYNVPCISGKDSMKNDSVRGGRKISIPPTVLFSTLGKIDEIGRAVSMYFKWPGDVIYLAGWTRDELGASEYHRLLAAEQNTPDRVGGKVPRVYVEEALPLYRALEEALRQGLVRSSHTPTLGGLAVALALPALGGDTGATVDLAAVPVQGDLRTDAVLFSESNSRFVLTCAPEHTERIESLFDGLPLVRLGCVEEEPRLRLRGSNGKLVVDAPLDSLRKAFTSTLWNM